MSSLLGRILTAALAVVFVAGFPGSGLAAAEGDIGPNAARPDAARPDAARPVKNVGIVFDGPPPEPERFTALVELVREETTSLTRRDFAVAFPRDKQLTADWTIEGIRRAVDEQLADPEVDLVLTLGLFSSHDASRRRDLPKPVLAPVGVDVDAQSLPVRSDAQGRSSPRAFRT